MGIPRSSAALALLCLLIAPAFVAGCAADEASAADAPASEEDEIVRAVRLEELPKASALRAKVEAQDSEWGDENIMNGGVGVIARKVALPALTDLDKVAKAALIDRMRADEVKLRGTITAAKPAKDAVPEAAKIMAVDGFFFSESRENIAPVEAAMKKLVAALGPAADLEVGVAKAKVITEFDSEGDPVRVTAYVFANKKTGELVVFYARQATG